MLLNREIVTILSVTQRIYLPTPAIDLAIISLGIHTILIQKKKYPKLQKKTYQIFIHSNSQVVIINESEI